MKQRFQTYAEQNAPRYTSYPTAPHFSTAIGPADMRGWLAALRPENTLSLYIHVPYCTRLCWYCGCNTYAARREEPLRDYVDTLLTEIDLIAAQCGSHRLTELHWGGGTPNILDAQRFEQIVDRLERNFESGEITHHAIELDPRFLDMEKAAAYARRGVTRVSLGVQDLSPHVQAAIGRIQPLRVVEGAIETLRSAGLYNISIDLMYGLPHQTRDDLSFTIEHAVRMQPGRIALFGYAHVPWFKKRQRLIPVAALPGASERFEQAAWARERLETLGYVAIGLDHFAHPDDAMARAASAKALTRSFQGYVVENADALIGLGPSAISTLPHGYAQNAAEPGAWASAINGGALATIRGHTLSAEDHTRWRLITQIMCDFSADLSPLGGAAACASEIAALGLMIADGLVRIEGDHVRLTDEGKPFCRLVALAFDDYASHAAARHSRAV